MQNMQTLNRELKMAELERIKMEAEKMRAETLKLQSEAIKLQKETKYYPMIIVVSASIATTITTLFALFQWLVNKP